MNREIKFEVLLKGKHFGYEQINSFGEWEWTCTELNSDKFIRWTKGVMTGAEFIRRQYTGLKDKNEVEIYEGDIVTFMYKNPKDILSKMKPVFCQIVWNEKGMWSLKWIDEYINNHFLNCDKIEVVGNIYQNSELLK